MLCRFGEAHIVGWIEGYVLVGSSSSGVAASRMTEGDLRRGSNSTLNHVGNHCIPGQSSVDSTDTTSHTVAIASVSDLSPSRSIKGVACGGCGGRLGIGGVDGLSIGGGVVGFIGWVSSGKEGVDRVVAGTV